MTVRIPVNNAANTMSLLTRKRRNNTVRITATAAAINSRNGSAATTGRKSPPMSCEFTCTVRTVDGGIQGDATQYAAMPRAPSRSAALQDRFAASKQTAPIASVNEASQFVSATAAIASTAAKSTSG